MAAYQNESIELIDRHRQSGYRANRIMILSFTSVNRASANFVWYLELSRAILFPEKEIPS